jgi:hypothetical protein
LRNIPRLKRRLRRDEQFTLKIILGKRPIAHSVIPTAGWLIRRLFRPLPKIINLSIKAGRELFPRVGFIVTNLTRPAKRVVRFYNQRGTAEQWIKEGKNAVKWTRLSCHDFVDNQVRLQLFVLAYNLGNFLRQAVLPQSVRHWTLTTLREKLIKIGAKVVRHSRQIVFQMAEVAVPRDLFRAILEGIGRLRLATVLSG